MAALISYTWTGLVSTDGMSFPRQAEAGREETILTVLRFQVLFVFKAFLTLPGFDF